MRAALVSLLYTCLILRAHGHPIDWIRKFGASTQDGSWLWGWAWAADGSVSVVDRTPVLTYPARPASFGTELSDPLLGYVIPLSSFTEPCPADNNTSRYPFIPDPVQGCPDLCVSGSHQPERSEAWIALVQRGGCPFVEKARQAQALGAKAIVVGGDKENPDALLNMYSERDSSDVHIAATFIKYWDYAELLALIASSNTTHQGLKTVSLLLSTEYSAWEWYSPIITFIIILLLPSILTFITLLIHRIRTARAAQRERAPEEFVHSLPWRVWTGTGWEKHAPTLAPEDPSEDPSSSPDVELGLTPSGSHEDDEPQPSWVDEQMECAICLEIFVKGDRVRVLPCGHLFHLGEIDEWLISKKKVCPICKADITQPKHHLHHDIVPAVQEDNAHQTTEETRMPSDEDNTPPPNNVPTERTPLLSSPPLS